MLWQVRRGMIASPAAFAAAAGGGPPSVQSTTWNPSDKSARIDLTNGNLTATENAGVAVTAMVRATVSRTTGKFVFTVDPGTSTSGVAIGYVESGLATNAAVTNAATSMFGINPSGILFSGAGPADATGGPTWDASTSEVMIAIDLDNNRGAYAVNGGAWYGTATSADPATGTNCLTLDNLGAVFPAINFVWTGDAATANFGASAFTKTIPVGFYSWDGNQAG